MLTFSTTSEAVLETVLTASFTVADAEETASFAVAEAEETASDELTANVGSCAGTGASSAFKGVEEYALLEASCNAGENREIEERGDELNAEPRTERDSGRAASERCALELAIKVSQDQQGYSSAYREMAA